MAFPFGHRFTAVYEDAFEEDRRNLGLGGPNFDFFFMQVEAQVLAFPWVNAEYVPESEDTLMRETREPQPDLPALYVYYKVSVQDERVRFIALSPAWSKTETF